MMCHIVNILKSHHDYSGAIPFAYSLSFSGVRDQEDCGSKPAGAARANSLQDPISKIPNTKKG
jgi:hypothetical protein